MVKGSKGIVLELQRDCLDPTVAVSTILRKAKVIASKLDLKELGAWIDTELNGYECGMEELPPHRKGIGAPKFKNPYHGWCPIMTDGGWFGRMVRTVFMPQPISELESLAAGGKSDILIMQYDPSIQQALAKRLPAPMECGLHFSKGQVQAALEFVRNKTLQWALELEEKRIVGEDLSFEESQKKDAQVVTNHIYGGNIGVLGSVAGDVKNKDFYSAGDSINIADASSLAQRIREALPALPAAMQDEMEVPLSDLEAELAASNPRPSKVQAALTSMRTVLEGAAGNLAASGILAALEGIAS